MLTISTVMQIQEVIYLPVPNFQLTHLTQTLVWWKKQKHASEKTGTSARRH